MALGGLDQEPLSTKRVVGAIAAGAPAAFLVAAIVPQIFAAFGPPAGPVLAGVAVLLVAAAALRFVLTPAPRGVPLAVAALAGGFALAANLWPPFDRGHPRPDTVFFSVG